MEPPKSFSLLVDQTREQLYDDWNQNTNKFGTIKEEEQ